MRTCRSNHGPRFQWFNWQGLELLAIENELIRVVVWPGHGADIIEFRHKRTDFDVLWKNPRVWPPRPSALDQPHAARSEFYDVFHGGWFVSLPSGFFPSAWPNAEGPSLGCHGELQSVPWEVEVVECDGSVVVVRAVGRSIRTPLRLERFWRIHAGSPILFWEEALVNESTSRMPIAWLHHPGFGGPLIDGARIVSKAKKVTVPDYPPSFDGQLRPGYEGRWPLVPETDTGKLRDCSQVPPAGSSLEHVVHLSDLDVGWGAIWNETHKLGFGLRWDEKFFPYMWSWACGRCGEGYPLWGSGHTVTLQPSTSERLPFPQILARNQVHWLESKGLIKTALSAGYLDDPADVFPLRFS